MGLLQKAYETYENHRSYIGGYQNNEESREPLAPVAHIITSAQITITIDCNGQFFSAELVGKGEPKIIIPVTEESAGRTSGVCPHPLCDNLGYLTVENKAKYIAYIEQLTDWAESEYTHPMLHPILTYVKGQTILADLARAGLEKCGEKDTVRWVVLGLESGVGSCWTDPTLFDAFTRYYSAKKTQDEQVLCMITGETTAMARQHLKGVVSFNGNAKIISANDKKNFTYRGRFKTDDQALTVGYEASQKAHNALKWLAASQGVTIDGRTFLCWNPKGKRIHKGFHPLVRKQSEPIITVAAYREELTKTLYGYQHDFDHSDSAVIAVFDAATTGRLAVTYYNEILVRDFLNRLADWDMSCAWRHWRFGIEAPSLNRIVDCAYGTPRNGRWETDDKVRKQQMQRLFSCRVDGGKMPFDLMQTLVSRTMRPLSYDDNQRDQLQFTTCAVIRKYYLDWKREEYQMALEKEKHDISYQYGRLLAVLEKAERDTYDSGENREPNAMRLQSMYCTRPAETAAKLINHIKGAYYPKLRPGTRIYYDRLIGEIYEQLSIYPEAEQKRALRETYIMGYYLQKNALYTKTTSSETEEE